MFNKSHLKPHYFQVCERRKIESRHALRLQVLLTALLASASTFIILNSSRKHASAWHCLDDDDDVNKKFMQSSFHGIFLKIF